MSDIDFKGILHGLDGVRLGNNRSPVDTGYFYAPYIPLTSTPVVDLNAIPKMNIIKEPTRPTTPGKYRSIDDEWGGD